MGKNVDYHSDKDWLYSGDVNAKYGGIWIRHYGDYCDAWRIVDLDSACGFDGAVLIENCTASIYGARNWKAIRESVKRIKSALSCYGYTYADIRELPRAQRHAVIWDAMINYGYGDVNSIEILQLDADYPMQCRDGWKADRRQTGGDIGGYVMAKYLD